MAIADSGGSINGKKVEFVFIDHLNRADIGSAKAREWIDRDGVAMIMVGANASAMPAAAQVPAVKT